MNFSMRKANRVLNSIYDGHLQSCGLKGGQYTILRTIDYFKKTSSSELQDVMFIDQTTLSRNLKPLIRDGYIDVNRGEDLRVKVLSLSPSGEKLYSEATKCWQNAQRDVKRRLGAEPAKQIFAVAKMIEGLKV